MPHQTGGSAIPRGNHFAIVIANGSSAWSPAPTAFIRVTRSCICGSDLHLYHGLVPDTRVGTTFGHEFTGIVEEIGSSVQNLKVGDHVLVPFNISCGSCFFCERELYGNCHDTNPAATAVGAIYGYSHTAGGYDGGQAEFVRVPMADVGPYQIPSDMDLDDAVLLTDAYPTGYQAAEMGGIKQGDTVVVFGAGPVGIFAAKSAWLLGAGRVNVVEGIFSDLKRGYVPNIFAEMGWKSEWKYNRAGAIKKVAIASSVLAIATIYFVNRRKQRAQPVFFESQMIGDADF